MLKKKIGVMLLVLITTLALVLPIARAAETETDTNATEAEAVSTDGTTEDQVTTTETNMHQGDVYLTGDDVTIDYVIDGNVFVFANNVTINSQIGGDAFIFANNVTIAEQGYIFSNLFVVAPTLNLSGVIYDVYALSNNVTMTGYVYRDIKISTDTLNLYGTIGRNAFVNCNTMHFSQNTSNTPEEEITIGSQGMINGSLQYTSKNEISIPEGSVTGEITYNQAQSGNSIQSYLISLGTIIATAILVWLVCLWLAPKFVKKENLIDKRNILPEIGLGILTPIVLIVVSLILIVLGITSPFGLWVLALTFILMGLSTSIFVISLNNLVCNKLKIEKNIGKFGMLIVTAAVLWLIGLIPYVGMIFGVIVVIIGLGIIVYHLFKKEKKEEKGKKVEKVEKSK